MSPAHHRTRHSAPRPYGRIQSKEARELREEEVQERKVESDRHPRLASGDTRDRSLMHLAAHLGHCAGRVRHALMRRRNWCTAGRHDSRQRVPLRTRSRNDARNNPHHKHDRGHHCCQSSAGDHVLFGLSNGSSGNTRSTIFFHNRFTTASPSSLPQPTATPPRSVTVKPSSSFEGRNWYQPTHNAPAAREAVTVPLNRYRVKPPQSCGTRSPLFGLSRRANSARPPHTDAATDTQTGSAQHHSQSVASMSWLSHVPMFHGPRPQLDPLTWPVEPQLPEWSPKGIPLPASGRHTV